MTTATLTGQQIKMGRPGKAPQIGDVIWLGTAEVHLFDCARVPAALVTTDRGQEMAVVRLHGNDHEVDRWWDARCVGSREWEDADGELIGDTRPDIAARIDAVLLRATDRHEQARRELHDRVFRGTYSVAADAQ